MTKNNFPLNAQHDDSPLKNFAIAKSKILTIFSNIFDHCSDSERCFESEILSKIGLSSIQSTFTDFKSRVTSIQKILRRDKMKVVFFGRTSNGKSSVVNCMLHSEVVPVNIGHTTSCFIQIEGSDDPLPKMLFDDITNDYSLQRVEQLSTDISSKKLSPDSLMRLLLPKQNVALLKDDVVLVDSPGVDVTPDLDLWIDRHCMDADVFVLVENSVSTLSQAEKNFFVKVSSQLSKPNIFVLYNQWDASAGYSEAAYSRVKEQHIQRSLTFLTDELKVTDRKTAQKRIFFVSARETLDQRINRSGHVLSGQPERLAEFEQFELVFQDCISNSAIHTKFEHHALFAKNLMNEAAEVISKGCQQAVDVKTGLTSKRRETEDKLIKFRQDLSNLVETNQRRVAKLMESAEIVISQSFKAEIKRLHHLLKEYDAHFSTTEDVLLNYKRGLNDFVEESVRLSMSARCSALDREIKDSIDDIIESMMELVPGGMADRFRRLIPLSRFVLNYHVDLVNMCSDFREDIDFHFSLHPSRLLGMSRVSEGVGQLGIVKNLGISAALISSAALKDVGWRAISLVITAYCLFYLYEKFTWTTKAREKALKRQYASYAAKKLNSIVDLTSSSCGQQIKQELSGLSHRLSHAVGEYEKDLEGELAECREDFDRLDLALAGMQKCRHRSSLVSKQLDEFLTLF